MAKKVEKIPKPAKKTGRPKLATGKIRDTELRIRLTMNEYSQLQKTAEKKGVTLADLVRHRIGIDQIGYGTG